MDRLRWLPFLIVSAILANAADAQAIDRSKLIDLTCSFNDKTVYWPNTKGFRLWPIVLRSPPCRSLQSQRRLLLLHFRGNAMQRREMSV